MAKNHPTFKKNTQTLAKPKLQFRELPPKIETEKNQVVILCPFCAMPHPISVGKESPCGTSLRVTAVQTLVPARTVKEHNLKCIKCNRSGGEMVRYHNGYIHTIDCAPGTRLLAEPPKFSKIAKIVYSLPKWLRAGVEKVSGRAHIAKEVDPQGVDTGRTLGYFFYKQRNPVDKGA